MLSIKFYWEHITGIYHVPFFAVISVEEVQVQWQTLHSGFAQVLDARPTFMILSGVFTLMAGTLFFFFNLNVDEAVNFTLFQ